MEIVNISSSNGCLICFQKDRNEILITTSADGLCIEHRKERHDKKACFCGERYRGQRGWYVPSFGSYSDITYVCPKDIINGYKQYLYKNRRMKEIEVELDKLWKKRSKYKYNCKGSRANYIKIESLRDEYDKCFAGSGWNPSPNT